MSKSKILFQLTGSIACFKACQLLSKLVQAGHDVEVVASRSALKFVGEATLEGLTGKKVHTETFAPGEYMNHIHLVRWADLVLLCPATANTINKMANGVGDDLITTLFLAHDFKKPYLVAPAMNTQMMQHPSTRASLEKLGQWGLKILASGNGQLACGEVGEGRLMEPDDLLREIDSVLSTTSRVAAAPGLRVLVTAGGTREPIDGVRSLTNTSTGRTGVAIAEQMSAKGHDVTLLRAKDAFSSSGAPARIRELTFVTFADLARLLSEELGRHDYDVVIHAAAVGDYSLDSIESGGKKIEGSAKIESDENLVLRLKRNPKLVDGLKAMSRNKKLRVVAFKLTNSKNPDERKAAIKKLALHAKPDLIVHNDVSEISAAGDEHLARIFSSQDPENLGLLAEAKSKAALAATLEAMVSIAGRA